MYYVLNDIKVIGKTLAKKGEIVPIETPNYIPGDQLVNLAKISKVVPEPGHKYILIAPAAGRQVGQEFYYESENELSCEDPNFNKYINILGVNDLSYHFVDITTKPDPASDAAKILSSIEYKFLEHKNPVLISYLWNGREYDVRDSVNIIRGSTSVVLKGKWGELDLMEVKGLIGQAIYTGHYNEGLKKKKSVEPMWPVALDADVKSISFNCASGKKRGRTRFSKIGSEIEVQTESIRAIITNYITKEDAILLTDFLKKL